MIQKFNKRGGFTLVEIMIVVAIIALLAAIAVPSALRARKRSQATRTLEELRIIDAAMDQYAIEFNKAKGAAIAWSDIQLYLKAGTNLYTSGGKDLFGKAFGTMDKVDTAPSVNSTTKDNLNDVADEAFWSPYGG